MPIKELGPYFDRVFRNDLNDNFKEVVRISEQATEALKKSGMNFANLYSNGEKVNIAYDWTNKTIVFNVKTEFGVLVISERFATNLPQGITNITLSLIHI